jgi:RNA 3'-terminal phosphate cyclase (ATP)
MDARAEVRIDGGGPGADEALRTALALSIVTGRTFEVAGYGRDRDPAGFGAEALAWVRAAASLSGATAEGATEGATALVFRPGARPAAGEHAFDLGGAGPVALLVEMLLPALALAAGPCRLQVRGATHGPDAATFHDLALGVTPALRRVGLRADVTLARAAFEPDPEGQVTLVVAPGCAAPLLLRRRGILRQVRVIAAVAGLPAAVGVRMSRAARKVLEARGVPAEEEGLSLPHATSRGATVTVHGAYERIDVTSSAVATDPAAAEGLGRGVAERFLAHHESGAAVDGALAARLAPVLAATTAGLCGGGAPVHRFTVSRLDAAFLRVADAVSRFLPVDVTRFGREGEPGEVRIAPRGVGEVLAFPGGRPPG